MRILLSGITVGAFILASISDLKTKRVVNLIWWIGGGAAIILAFMNGTVNVGSVTDIGLFMAIQLFWFKRFYGRADCYAFIVSALYLTSFGLGLRQFLYQMLLSILLLGTVQIFKKNVNNHGNLVIPVPFIPYITLALCGVLWYYISC